MREDTEVNAPHSRTSEDEAASQGMGRAIAREREQRGIARQELASESGVDLSTLEQIEKGSVDADWAALRVIARALGLSLDALIKSAEEHAPRLGGEEWRRHAREAEKKADS